MSENYIIKKIRKYNDNISAYEWQGETYMYTGDRRVILEIIYV